MERRLRRVILYSSVIRPRPAKHLGNDTFGSLSVEEVGLEGIGWRHCGGEGRVRFLSPLNSITNSTSHALLLRMLSSSPLMTKIFSL
jgi:hypothetical protein